MSDDAVLAAILAAPWAKAAALLDVGGVALSCTLACVEDVALCGAEVEEAIELAFEDITYERTVRVSTDLTWTLGGDR